MLSLTTVSSTEAGLELEAEQMIEFEREVYLKMEPDLSVMSDLLPLTKEHRLNVEFPVRRKRRTICVFLGLVAVLLGWAWSWIAVGVAAGTGGAVVSLFYSMLPVRCL